MNVQEDQLRATAQRIIDALEIGAMLLSIYTSGAFGTAVDATFLRQGGEAIFRLDVTLPYEKPVPAAQDEAEVFLRYLTRVKMPEEVVIAALLASDRLLLFGVDAPELRAGLITRLELAGLDPSFERSDLADDERLR